MATTPTFYIDPKDGTPGGIGTITDPKNDFPSPLVSNTVYGLKRGTTLYLSATSNITVASVSMVAYGDETLPKPKIDANGYANVLLLNTVTANHFYAENIHFTGRATDTVCAVEIQNVLNPHLKGCIVDCVGSGGILINGATANATIEDCEVKVSESGKRGIYLLSAPAGVNIRRNTITFNSSPTASGNQGIACPTGAGAAVILDNTIQGWYTGIELDASNGHTVQRNNVIDCTNEGIAITASNSNIIELNTIERTNTGSGAGSGVIISGTSADNQTRRNIFKENHQSYIDTSSGGGNDVIANYFRDSSSNHISFQADSTNRAIVMNNTLRHFPTTAGHGFVVQGTLTNVAVDFKNNLIVTGSRQTNAQGLEIAGTITTRALYINNNMYWTVDGGRTAALDNVDYDSFESWKTAIAGAADVTGDDVNSVFMDPGITDWDDPIPSNISYEYICEPMGGRFLDLNGRVFPNPPIHGAFQLSTRRRVATG